MGRPRPGRHPSSVTEPTDTSNAWSGAVVTTGTSPLFFTVAGRWTVPHIAPFADGDDRHMSAWVGIDGFGNHVLLQAGIHAVMSSGDAHPDVHAWIEWLPDDENEVDLPVAVGDTMSCVVTRDQECLPGGTVQIGQWESIDDDHRLVAMHDGKVLDWVAETGDWRLWAYVPGNHADCLPGNPVSHGNWASLRVGHVLVPMSDAKVIDWVPDDGTWRLWAYVPSNLQDCLPGDPVSHDRWTSLGDDHTLVSMKDGKVLDWVTDGNFRLFNYNAQGRSTVDGTIVLSNETQHLRSTFHMRARSGPASGPDGAMGGGAPDRGRGSLDTGRLPQARLFPAHANKVGGALVKASAGENIEMSENLEIGSKGTASGKTVTCVFVQIHLSSIE